MKRYVRSDTSSKREYGEFARRPGSVKGIDGKAFDIKGSFLDDPYRFFAWSMPPDSEGDSEGDNDEFSEMLEKLIRKNFDVSDYYEEPSIQGSEGEDNIFIKLRNGSEYTFSFSWPDMQEAIHNDGPKAAARSYFDGIKEDIESGSALVEE